MSDTMTNALLNYKREHGHASMRALLFEVAGVTAMSDVPASKIEDVTAAASESGGDYKKPKAKAFKADADFNSQKFVDSVYAKWNGA